jgi:hypothetical protein
MPIRLTIILCESQISDNRYLHSPLVLKFYYSTVLYFAKRSITVR